MPQQPLSVLRSETEIPLLILVIIRGRRIHRQSITTSAAGARDSWR